MTIETSAEPNETATNAEPATAAAQDDEEVPGTPVPGPQTFADASPAFVAALVAEMAAAHKSGYGDDETVDYLARFIAGEDADVAAFLAAKEIAMDFYAAHGPKTPARTTTINEPTAEAYRALQLIDNLLAQGPEQFIEAHYRLDETSPGAPPSPAQVETVTCETCKRDVPRGEAADTGTDGGARVWICDACVANAPVYCDICERDVPREQAQDTGRCPTTHETIWVCDACIDAQGEPVAPGVLAVLDGVTSEPTRSALYASRDEEVASLAGAPEHVVRVDERGYPVGTG